MATVNGGSAHLASDAFGGLGKRKRTASQDRADSRGESTALHYGRAQQSLEDVLNLLRNYDPSPSLLKHPLPAKSVDEPDTKRARFAKSTNVQETIESRVTSGAYDSLDEMVEDIDLAASAILENKQVLTEQVNGENKRDPAVESEARNQISIIQEMVMKRLQQQKARDRSVQQAGVKDFPENDVKMSGGDGHNLAQVLTLRAHSEKGPKQVYTGLQRPASTIVRSKAYGIPSATFDTIDGKTLPNGFDLAEVSSLDAHTKRSMPQEARTIGEVFRSHRSLKPLEAPRSSRPTARNSLDFVGPDSSAFERTLPTHKQDYKFVRLPTAGWLHYGETEPGQTSRQAKPSTTPGSDTKDELAKTSSLFYTSYSSFAPSQDASTAVVSERERSQLWWNRCGEERFKRLFSSQYPSDGLNDEIGSPLVDLNDDLSTAVANFEPDDGVASALQSQETDAANPESLLNEVSELLGTLSSYQVVRSLDTPNTSASASSPSLAEFDVYELLRNQLALLVDALPPFAVAKLNGDQLSQLNISTKIIVEGSDYSGTGEVDEYTLQRRKAAAVAASAAARTTTSTPAPVRPAAYQSPSTAATAAANYNPRRNYNSGVPAPNLATYGSANSTSQSFQTPRAPTSVQRPAYPQQSYQSTATPSYSQPSVQQFQRPTQNGYSNYGSGTPSQASYLQRPSQPGYQQRAQESVGNYGMPSASPQKPVMNGQPYPQAPNQLSYSQNQQLLQQRQRLAQGATATPTYSANPNQRTQIAQIELVNAQALLLAQQSQLQNSGTPVPKTPGSGYSPYDGLDERGATATPGVGGVKGEASRDRSVSAAVSVGAGTN